MNREYSVFIKDMTRGRLDLVRNIGLVLKCQEMEMERYFHAFGKPNIDPYYDKVLTKGFVYSGQSRELLTDYGGIK